MTTHLHRPQKYALDAGLQISLDGAHWFRLTDHNRGELQYNTEVIEKQSRMANGTLRKYVVATKNKLSVSWDFIPSKTDSTVDGYFSSEWLEAFYSANVFVPVHVKAVRSMENTPKIGFYPNESTRKSAITGEEVFLAYITNLTVNIIKRNTNTDFVNMSIEFTEI